MKLLLLKQKFLAPSLIALGLTLLFVSGARASVIGDSLGFSPYWDWRTMETKNFRITFPAALEPQARKSAEYLEEAHLLLSPRLHWQTRHLTQIVIVDNTDLANGLTSAALRLGIVLLITPPDTTFSTQYYDDWLRLLCIHEYTHMLNMDVTRSWVEVLRYIFGDAIRPNAMWPVWMLEGLAVYMETRLTHGGRGRSPFYEMVLRSAVEDKTLNTSSFITLDKLHGTNPWFPAGETAYLFGYQMMNQVSKDKELNASQETDDGKTKLKSGEDALGIMSYRSGGRVPFFINGNLENITGKSWYDYWNEWVAETQVRMEKQLQKIKSQPVSPVKRISDPSVEIIGVAASPDGKWLAYTIDSSDERMSLYLKNLRTGDIRKVSEKIWGVGLAFSPDSQTLFFSSIQRSRQYYLFSDLAAYDIARDSIDWISDSARFKDPDVSRDGRQIVFTVTKGTANSIAIASLRKSGRNFEMGSPKVIHESKMFESAANPKFSADGKSVIFSFHGNGKQGSDLLRFNLDAHTTEPVVADQKTNRFPTFGPSGDLYFVSDRTGVDNLYRVRKNGKNANQNIDQVTNVTTGIWLPSIGSREGREFAYSSVFTSKGWSLAEVQLADRPFSTTQATVEPPPAPAPYEPTPSEKSAAKSNSRGEVENYSIFPSILPRQWAPVIYGDGVRTLVGAQVLGFDAIDEHEYLLFGSYDTLIKMPDGIIQYNNRSFGPNITLLGAYQTSSYTTSGGNLQFFSRKATGAANISWPLLSTFSSLTPSIGAQAQREFLYILPDRAHASSATRFVPSTDFTLTFDNRESSRLALLSESGRRIQGGVRRYFDSDGDVTKGLVSWAEFVKLGDHFVVIPAVAGTLVSRVSTFSDANANAKSIPKYVQSADQTPTERSLDQLRIRGYPGQSFVRRSIGLGSLDLRFPIARIFRGWGTNPIFFRNFYAVGFAEATVLPGSTVSNSVTLPAAGGGLRLSSDFLLNIPLIFSTEFHQGFKKEYGGKGEVIFSILTQSLI